MTIPSLLENGPRDGPHTVILAHGAGAPMDSDFMEFIARRLAEQDVAVVRFEFPYMAARRRDGRRRPPDRQPLLLDTWRDVIGAVRSHRPHAKLFIGGKSMGGRMASILADELQVDGLVCLGYPFHPPGKPDKLRVEHLEQLETPALIVQGERDAMGRRDEVARYRLSENVQVHYLPDGDHSFKPRKASGHTEAGNWQAAADAVAAFVSSAGFHAD